MKETYPPEYMAYLSGKKSPLVPKIMLGVGAVGAVVGLAMVLYSVNCVIAAITLLTSLFLSIAGGLLFIVWQDLFLWYYRRQHTIK